MPPPLLPSKGRACAPLRPTLNTPLPLSILKKILMTEQIDIQTWNLLCDTSNRQIVTPLQIFQINWHRDLKFSIWHHRTIPNLYTYTPVYHQLLRRHKPDTKACVRFNEFKDKLCAWVEYNIFLFEWHKYLFSRRNSTSSFWLLWPLINLWRSCIRMFICSYACLITCLITYVSACLSFYIKKRLIYYICKIGNFKQFLLFLHKYCWQSMTILLYRIDFCQAKKIMKN